MVLREIFTNLPSLLGREQKKRPARNLWKIMQAFFSNGQNEPEQPASLRLHRHFLHLIPGQDEAQHDS
jgi:hypothetical protein